MLLPNCRTCCWSATVIGGDCRVREDQRDQHVVPDPEELEDAERGDRRPAERQHDPGEQPHLARAVQPRRLQQLPGDLREEVPQQEDREGQAEGDMEEHHAGRRLEEADARRTASTPGSSATCTGTTSSPTTARNHQSRPGNSIQAKAYPASEPMTTTRTVAGTVIATVDSSEPVIVSFSSSRE